MTHDIRKFMNLMENAKGSLMELDLTPKDEPKVAVSTLGRDEHGRATHPGITMEPTKGKVTAKLTSYNSQSYTKLAQKVLRIKELSAEVKTLEEEVKQETREDIADLFGAADIVYTRVVETVSFVMTLSKNPEPTKSVKYAEVLKELEEHLTPDLISKLELIKKKFSSISNRSPSLSIAAKESVMEGMWAKFRDFFHRLLESIMAWGQSYDESLNRLQLTASEAGLMTESEGGGEDVYPDGEGGGDDVMEDEGEESDSDEGDDSGEEQLDEISDNLADRAYTARLDKYKSVKGVADKTAATADFHKQAATHGGLGVDKAQSAKSYAVAKDEADHFAQGQRNAADKLNKNAQLNQGRQFNKMAKMDQHNTPYSQDAHDADEYNAAKAKSEKYRDHAPVREDEEEVTETVDYTRIDRIEKQVEFMVRSGRSRQYIIANIGEKMGPEEADYAGDYFDEYHKDHVGSDATMESAAPKKSNVKSLYGHQYIKEDEDAGGDADEKGDDAESEEVSEDDVETPEGEMMAEFQASMKEPMAYQTGATVYCGGREGKIVGTVPGKPDTWLVELPNGQHDAFPKGTTSSDKPSFFKKAFHSIVGESK
jgi:hypothetical protein